MTVKKLRDFLATCPDDVPVVIVDFDLPDAAVPCVSGGMLGVVQLGGGRYQKVVALDVRSLEAVLADA